MAAPVDLLKHNRHAWDRLVAQRNRWTKAVNSQQVAAARAGKLSVVLTPSKPVPQDWFPPLAGCRTLCLASAGGQQAPLLAAAGANVCVLDNSPQQLAQDGMVAARDGLRLSLHEGDMRDLSRFDDGSFDFVFHPCSNSFIPDVQPVWNETHRVLRPGGTMIAGMCNPICFIFDYEKYQAGDLIVRHSIPYSDLDSLSEDESKKLLDDQQPICFGHKLESQIGGQLQAGFQLIGFYEDYWGDDQDNLLDSYLPSFIATRVSKP